jgi:hypothetical protein
MDWRDFEPEPSFFAKLFQGKKALTRRLRKRPDDEDNPPLNHMEEKPLDEMSPAERKARRRRIERHEAELRRVDPMINQNCEKAKTMSTMSRICKSVAQMGEHEFVRVTTNAAAQLYPSLTREQAFAKLLMTDEATQRLWLVSKGVLGPYSQSVTTESATRENLPALYPAEDDEDFGGNELDSETLDDYRTNRRPRATRAGESEDNISETEEVSDEDDAYEKLMRKAAVLHEKDPSKSIAQHFTKLFTTPGNKLAQLERAQSMTKLAKSMMR